MEFQWIIRAEFWEKIISTEINLPLIEEEGLNRNQLSEFLRECLNSSYKYSTHIEKVLKYLNKSELERVFIEKERKQIRGIYNKKHKKWEFRQGNDRKGAPLENSNVILIEQTKIRTLKTRNQTIDDIRSICLESMRNLRPIKQFIDTFIKIPIFHLASYPEFIKNPNIIN